MKTAIKALEDRQKIVQQEIGFKDDGIAQRRKQIEYAKAELLALYQERDELASAIFVLGTGP